LRRALMLILTCWLIALPVWAQAANDARKTDKLSRFYGREISKLKLEYPHYMDGKAIKRAAKLKEGGNFDRFRVRETLRNYYLLGDVHNAAVEAKDDPDGKRVMVTVKLYPLYTVRDIRVVNNFSYNVQEILLDILHLESGDDWHDEDEAKYRKKLQDALARAGHLKAEVKFDVTKTKRKVDNKVDLRIKLNERPTFRIEKFDFTDSELSIYTKNEILKRAKWKEGMDFNQEDIEDGVSRLKKWLFERGHREARVPDLDYRDTGSYTIDDARSRMVARFPIKVGPRVDIWYDGECFTCGERKWKFKDVLGLDNQKRFNEWIAKDFVKRIRLYFQRQGNFLADVDYEYQEFTEPNGLKVKRLNFVAEHGPTVKIRDIAFEDNRSFDDSDLLDLLKTKKYYVETDFSKDLENVINFYNQHGFLKAGILQKVVTFDERKNKIDILVVLDEGPQTILKSVGFVGNVKVSTKRMNEVMAEMKESLRIGEPLNPFVIQNTKARLLSEYFRRGYVKGRVKESVTISEEHTEANVTFTFTEGRQFFFGNIFYRGNKLTRKHIIERELVVREGDPYNFEKIFRSEQALIQLGFFTSVDIGPVSQDFESPKVDMLVTVAERKSGYITGGGGYNTFTGYSAAYETGHKNLAGFGRRLSFRIEAAVKDPDFRFDKRAAIVAFTWPWVARVPLDGTLTVRDAELAEIAYDVRSFTVTIGTTITWMKMMNFLEATHRNPAVREAATRNHGFADPFTSHLDWEYAKEFIFNIDDAVDDQEQGEITISTLSPMLIHDLRDNPFNPTRWTRNSIRFDYGPPWFLSQIHYLKVTGQSSWYMPIFELLPFLDGWVFGENIVVGHLQTLRDTDTVPISRRFFLGGSTTMRGFGQNQISPFGEDGETPVGGYFTAYQNTELRVPLPYNLGLLGFFDAGNVTDGTNTYTVDLVRTTAGMGFRYVTPIGPISADYGIKLDRLEDESFGEFYITIGNAF
jgi:outer membrane protein insertion porin family